MDIKMKKNGGAAEEKAAEAPIQKPTHKVMESLPQQPVQGEGGGMMSGFIKLNAMPASSHDDDSYHQQQ